MRKEIFVNGERYHIYNRGTGKCELFFDDQDKHKFLDNMQKYMSDEQHKMRVSIAAYALMPNHFHIALQQRVDQGISHFLNKISQSYALYFNNKYGRSGCLFSGRFRAKHVHDDGYFLHLTRYIHRNPLPLVGITALGDYPWSSYPTYLGFDNSPLVTDRLAIEMFRNTLEYKNFMDSWRPAEDIFVKDIAVDF